MSKFTKGNPGGPGRPRKADKHAGAIAKAEKKIADRLPDLIDNMLKLANGVWLESKDKDGNVIELYLSPPDFRANQYLIDRIMGKPTERQEVSGPDGGDLTIRTFTAALDKAYDDLDAPTE